MDPNQEETRPVTLLAWHWAKLEKIAAEWTERWTL